MMLLAWLLMGVKWRFPIMGSPAAEAQSCPEATAASSKAGTYPLQKNTTEVMTHAQIIQTH
jgi:hypothetical protein